MSTHSGDCDLGLDSSDVAAVKSFRSRGKHAFALVLALITICSGALVSVGVGLERLGHTEKTATLTRERQIINEERITRLEEHEKSIDSRLAEIITLIKERKP